MAPNKIKEAVKSTLVTTVSTEEKVQLLSGSTTSSMTTLLEKATDVYFSKIRRYSIDDNGGGYMGL
jgi:hypothetical protein